MVKLGDATIVVRTFPEDPRMAADMRRIADDLAARASGLEDLRRTLELQLRSWYPRMTIRPREQLASLSESEHVWYAMRDGHVHPPNERLDRLHAAMADARDVRSDSAEAMHRAKELTGSGAVRPGSRTLEAERGEQEPDAED
jgi:hypothetical protein